MIRCTQKGWRSRCLLGFVLGAGFWEVPAFAQNQRAVDLTELSLEELLQLHVTSAGKKEQRISEIPAAVYVITAEDIRRSHATTIPELLRQVPGIQVARETTGEWAISIRGFNDRHANKLLVLMDGRTLYSPLYSGVEWDAVDTMIQDIERIEVIRGPGASLWGANAVNGVINIITKQAKDTQGGLIASQGGTLETASIAGRYGGSIGKNFQYRMFAKSFSRLTLPARTGERPRGGWNSARQGGRFDWSPTDKDTVTVSGEWFQNNLREMDEEITSLSPPFESVVEEHDKTVGAFLLTRWNHRRSERSEFNLQFFQDENRQSDARGHDRSELVRTTDIEFQNHLKFRGRHDFVWGGGFRQVRDHVQSAFDSWFAPDRHTARTSNGFVQDEIGFLQDKLKLTVGSKFEWNSFSKFEVQPTVRLLWEPVRAHSFWTAASRAVRVPSREEVHRRSLESISLTDEGETAYELFIGTRDFRPEKLTAYEAGYRFMPTKRFSLDVASHYSVYSDLETIETGPEETTEMPIRGLLIPLSPANNLSGEVYGAEVTGSWTVNRTLQLSGGYTRLHTNLHRKPWSTDEDAENSEGKNARNIFYARAHTNLSHKLELNTELRFVGRIAGEDVPAYIDSDIHLSRSLGERLRLDGTFENWLNGRRSEWNYENGLVQGRRIRVSIEWRF